MQHICPPLAIDCAGRNWLATPTVRVMHTIIVATDYSLKKRMRSADILPQHTWQNASAAVTYLSRGERLASGAVQGAALALEGVGDVPSVVVLGVGHGAVEDGVCEGLQGTAALLANSARNALHATTAW